MGSSTSRKESHSSQQIEQLKDWASKLGFVIIHFDDLKRHGIKIDTLAAYKDWDND